MADYPFKINITTKDGTKKSFFTASLATNADTVVSSSVMVDRINNMFSASSFIESIEAPSLTSTKYNNASEGIKFLSASVTHPNTGSIIFTDKETSDNGGLDHYEFYGTKVCSVLGLPEGVPIYTENFKLSDSSTDTTNYISGEFISDRIALKKGFKMSPQARVQSNLVWDHVFGEGFLQWVSGSNTRMSIGYNNVTDRYTVSSPSGSFTLLQSSKFAGQSFVGNFLAPDLSTDGHSLYIGGGISYRFHTNLTMFNLNQHPSYTFTISNSSGTTPFVVSPENDSPLGVNGGAHFYDSQAGELPVIHIENTNGDANGPLILLEKDTTGEADNDVLGNIRWRGHDDDNNATDYARLYVRSTDVSDGTEDGDFHIQLMDNGTLDDKLVIGPTTATFTDDVSIGGDLTVTGDIDLNGNLVGDDATDITNIESISVDNVRADADSTNNYINLADNDISITVNGNEVASFEDNTINFNDGANDVDFRIEANAGVTGPQSAANMFKLDAGIGTICVGNTPQNTTDAQVFQITGNCEEWIHRVMNTGDSYTRKGMQVRVGQSSPNTANYAIRFLDSDGTLMGDITFNGTTVTYGTFTGVHNAYSLDSDSTSANVQSNFPTSSGDYLHYPQGTIVSMASSSYDGSLQPINFVVSSSTYQDKRAYGVYFTTHTDKMLQNQHNIAAIGDGFVLVNNQNGDIEIGDYITTASGSGGYGCKQSDDLLHNYTVAKATDSVIWSEHSGSTKLLACTYHCG